MLCREDVVLKYQALFPEELGVDHPAYGWLDQLPPNLCRALILRSGFKTAINSIPQAFVGSVNGDIRQVADVKVSVGKFNERLFSSLPLAGHLPLEVPGMCRWVESALESLQELDKEAIKFVRQWCSLILWVSPNAENPPDAVLTSVAVPILPHCTILSVKSLRHIPANHVYEGASTYALAENIFHEALHQQLSASLVFGEKITDDAESSSLQKIYIPWRNTFWELDRVIHAAWVYSNLQRLRGRALSKPEIFGLELEVVKDAERESRPKLDYLRSTLESEKGRISSSSSKLIEQVLA